MNYANDEIYITLTNNSATHRAPTKTEAANPRRADMDADGKKITVENKMTVSGADVTGKQETFIGATLGEAKLRRFLVGPKGCEITGINQTPDGKALLVNIQHPGENTPAIGSAAGFALQSR